MIVVHSIGRLVYKQALLLSLDHLNTYFHNIVNLLKSIVFIDTPYRGLWMAN